MTKRAHALEHRGHSRCTLKQGVVGCHYLLQQTRGITLDDGEADKRCNRNGVQYLIIVLDGNPVLRFLSSERSQHLPSHVTHTGRDGAICLARIHMNFFSLLLPFLGLRIVVVLFLLLWVGVVLICGFPPDLLRQDINIAKVGSEFVCGRYWVKM